MSGFVYFVPNAAGAAKETLVRAGLWPVLAGTNIVSRQVYGGPGGGQGILVMGAGGSAELCNYDAAKQVWQEVRSQKPEVQKIENNAGYWIGYWNDQPPVEADLRRKVQLAGHFVELRDSEKWLIPVARRFTSGSVLPRSMMLGANGEIVKETLPAYAAFGQRVERFWEDVQRQNGWLEGTPEFTEKEQWLLAGEAMAFNYHIGAAEINAMSLFNEQNLSEILSAVIDWETVLRVVKEMAAAGKKKVDALTDDTLPSPTGERVD